HRPLRRARPPRAPGARHDRTLLPRRADVRTRRSRPRPTGTMRLIHWTTGTMKLIHYWLPGRGAVWGLAERDRVYEIATAASARGAFLSTLLQWPDPVALLAATWPAISRGESVSLSSLMNAPHAGDEAHLLPPIDHQEVWAAG